MQPARLSAVATAALVVAAFVGSWMLLHHSWWGRHQLVDTPLYESYADAIRVGDVPYRDFSIEYPPGALPALLAPEVSARVENFGTYGHSFEKWMAGCGIALVVASAWALAALGVSRRRLLLALGCVAVSPLLLGNVMLSRFDLWPAALTAVMLAALLRGLLRTAAVFLGLAIVAKLYALVLAPLAFIWVLRRRGRRDTVRFAAWTAAVVAVASVPFAVLAPAGFVHSFGRQLSRPLQIESLGAAALVAVHHLTGLPLVLATDHGSQNIEGHLASVVAAVSTLAVVVLLVVIYIGFARSNATSQELVIAMTAALAVFIAFGKVFSPQFLIWLIAVVPLIAGARGAIAWAAFALAMVMTQVWFPDRYANYAEKLHTFESGLVLGRDLVMAALALLLTCWLWRARAPRAPA
jgi:glycosyl transferase family 87